MNKQKEKYVFIKVLGNEKEQVKAFGVLLSYSFRAFPKHKYLIPVEALKELKKSKVKIVLEEKK
uniref:Uncharacterized protein n=1 Tax=viral metagenome TaxID=1070528 RepID=A0A6M3XXW4_9ZZZZ